MKLKLNNKGISLPMTIGLLTLLVAMTATVNELVISALRASHDVEAADKAYFAAEGGIEDALYELSAHSAGYETQSLGTTNVRSDNFSDSTAKFKNEWAIKDRGLNTCGQWRALVPTICGQIRQGDKLVINMFSDNATSNGVPAGGINETPADIHTIAVNNVTIRFRLPPSLVSKNLSAFQDSKLHIDNDGDLLKSTKAGPEGILGLNEDGAPQFGYTPTICPYSGGVAVHDTDCDLKQEEDSPEDPVILWKVVDGNGHSFQPLRGCKGDPNDTSHPADPNATLCEKNFVLNTINPNIPEVAAEINQNDKGLDQDGNITTLQGFLTSYSGSTQTLQMEVLVVAPMEAVNISDSSKLPIPYYEYAIEYGTVGGETLPSTFFALEADGYYQDFKQSITTNVVPTATTQLLNLTIIQQ